MPIERKLIAKNYKYKWDETLGPKEDPLNQALLSKIK